MNAERDNKACAVTAGDIVDLVRDELPADKRGEVARHLEGCAACAAEADSVRATLDAARSVEVATSPGFVERTMARLANAKPLADAEAASPAPAEVVRTEAVHAPGPASRRLARIVARERAVTAWFRPRWRLMVLAGSAAACLAVVLLMEAWVLERPVDDNARLAQHDGQPQPKKQHNERRAVVARFMQRSDCALQHEAKLEGTMLDMGDLALGGDEIVVTGAIDLSQEENCLIAFRPTQWQAFTESAPPPEGAPGRGRWNVIASSRRVLTVRDGRIEIPDALLARHVPEPDVGILRFGDRTEIWSRSQLATYLERGVPRSISVDVDDLG